MNQSAEHDLARLLADLRREGRQQSGLAPHLVPPDAAAGYSVASLVADLLGWEVAGWKIAATNERMRQALRSDAPIYGRVFAPLVVPAPARLVHARLASPIPEVEYQARLGRDLPARAGAYTVAEVGEAVASLHVGIEVAECRFIHDAAFPALPAILADGAGSGTLVVGPAIEGWRERDVAGQEVVLRSGEWGSEGRERRRGTAAEAMEHPLEPLTWLANALSRTGIGLKAGQIVSTGTMTGMLAPKAGETFTADYGAFGTVEVVFT